MFEEFPLSKNGPRIRLAPATAITRTAQPGEDITLETRVLLDAAALQTFQLPVTKNEANYRGFDFVLTDKNGVKKYHGGVDYYNKDLKVMAAGSGTVYAIIKNKNGDHGFGNTVILEHTLANNTKVYSLYAHLDSFSASLKVGKAVLAGEVLGKMGATGSGSNGIVHLHFELKSRGVLGNPKAVGKVGAETHYGYVPVYTGISSAASAKTYGYFNPADYFGKVTFKAQSRV